MRGRSLLTIMTNGARKRHGRINYTLTAVRRVTHRRRRPIALCARFIPSKRCTRAYFKSFRRALLQNPGRHLGRRYDDPRLVVAMPPRVVVVEARVYGDDAFSTIMSCWAESGGFFGAPRNASEARRTFLIPPHAVVRAPRADGTVYARSLCLPRLEGARIA